MFKWGHNQDAVKCEIKKVRNSKELLAACDPCTCLCYDKLGRSLA